MFGYNTLPNNFYQYFVDLEVLSEIVYIWPNLTINIGTLCERLSVIIWF